jgi:hypothetical protein
MAEDRGSWLSSATVIFFGWSLLSVAVRIWVTIARKHAWGHADSTITLAIVCIASRHQEDFSNHWLQLFAILHLSSNFWAIKYGYGRPLEDISPPATSQVEKVRQHAMHHQ